MGGVVLGSGGCSILLHRAVAVAAVLAAGGNGGETNSEWLGDMGTAAMAMFRIEDHSPGCGAPFEWRGEGGGEGGSWVERTAKWEEPVVRRLRL